MGYLMAKSYPTKLMLKLADHTYVECGTEGKAWGCFGGKTGGKLIRGGDGSTKRAKQIAEKNEQAGLKCYLINGVCHQAANRILLPSKILVRGARGYAISEAMFGPYGRFVHWPCKSPFHRHPAVQGDLADCLSDPRADKEVVSKNTASSSPDNQDAQYISQVLPLYRKAKTLTARSRPKIRSIDRFHVDLFMKMVNFYLGPLPTRGQAKNFMEVRKGVELARRKPEMRVSEAGMLDEDFVKEFEDISSKFQDDMANLLSEDQYGRLFELNRDDRIQLADPGILEGMLKTRKE